MAVTGKEPISAENLGQAIDAAVAKAAADAATSVVSDFGVYHPFSVTASGIYSNNRVLGNESKSVDIELGSSTAVTEAGRYLVAAYGSTTYESTEFRSVGLSLVVGESSCDIDGTTGLVLADLDEGDAPKATLSYYSEPGGYNHVEASATVIVVRVG